MCVDLDMDRSARRGAHHRTGHANRAHQRLVCARRAGRIAGRAVRLAAVGTAHRFALVCVLSLCIIRPLAARALRGNVVATNADRLIGTTAIVEEHISPQKWGSVRVQGRVWSAVSMDGSSVEPGTRVRIKAIEGAKLIVMPIHGPKGEEHV